MVRSMLGTVFQNQHNYTLICLPIFLWTEIFWTKIRNQNIKQILRMFVRITCKKLKSRNWYFILSRFFVQDDQGWQGRGSLALCENVRLPVEAGRGQVSTYPLLLVPDRKLGLELLGHGFYGIPAGGHLPKPLHELLPNSWKLVPCQFQMANKHFFPR